MIQTEISKVEKVTTSVDQAKTAQEEKSTEDVQSEAQTEEKIDSAISQTNENEVSDQQKPEPEKKKGTCSKTLFKKYLHHIL